MRNNTLIKNHNISVFDIILAFGLFLFSINFMNKANYLIVILAVITLAMGYIRKENLPINMEFIILIICFTSYFLIYSSYFNISPQTLATFWFGPFVGYIIGYCIFDYNKPNSYKYIVFITSLGMFFHGLLNITPIILTGINARVVPDIWVGTNISATSQGTFFSMIASLLFYALFIEKKVTNKIILIVAILFSVCSSLITATRTLLLLIVISFIVNVILYVYLNKQHKNKVIKIVLLISVLLFILWLLYSNNIFNIKSIYEDSYLYTRMNIENQTTLSNDPRFDFYNAVLTHMFDYPMGGDKIPMPGFAHNLWLDTIKKVGIIPGFLLVIYSVLTLLTLIKFLKNKNVNPNSKYLFVSLYIVLTVNFMVEPILEGVPYMFIMMCVFNGATMRILNNTRYKRKEAEKHENLMALQHDIT